jgi:hypothetical protein
LRQNIQHQYSKRFNLWVIESWKYAYVNPELADKAMSAEEFEFGLFYGRRVEFEYFLYRASAGMGTTPIDSSKVAPHEPVGSLALLSNVDTTGHADAVHGVIAISVPRYEAWLAKISNLH